MKQVLILIDFDTPKATYKKGEILNVTRLQRWYDSPDSIYLENGDEIKATIDYSPVAHLAEEKDLENILQASRIALSNR